MCATTSRTRQRSHSGAFHCSGVTVEGDPRGRLARRGPAAPRPWSPAGHAVGEAGEQQRPSTPAADRVVAGLAAVEPLEVAVLDLDGGLVRPVRGEPDI